jgi:hypothetical protein
MPDPISPPVPEGQVAQPLPIEETPEIVVENQPPPPTKPKTSFGTTLGALILFVGLFGLGVWLSSYIRQYFPNGLNGITGGQQTPRPEADQPLAGTPTPIDPFAAWKIYQVTSGTTKLPVEGISFKLPPDILSPICDTTTCMSQGTYLPGGTRLTVAARGVGQLLADFRGSAISDVGGTVFTTKDTVVNGRNAKLFTGSFSGKTVGGYGFNQMRGYMIEVTPVLSLEFNHFTPIGITSDFAADDTLFDQIVSTLVMPGTPSATPVITSAPFPATSSGY